MTRILLASRDNLRNALKVQAANYTLAAADEGQVLHTGGGSGSYTYTLPDDVSVPFPVGGYVDVYRNNSGTLTITAAAGVTLRYNGQTAVAGSYAIPYQYALVRLVKLTATLWMVEPLTGLEDTGWVNITVNAGFTGNGTPQVRRIGKAVYSRSGWTNAGVAVNTAGYNVGQLPAGFAPAGTIYARAGTSAAEQQGEFVISSNGNVELRTGATLSSYYRLDAVPAWLID